MLIHQIICGETTKKSWGLLSGTIADQALAESIAFVANLQDESGSVEWKPVTRIFFHRDHFLVIKSFPDISPDVRNGRAFSHVLVISPEDVAKISNLSSLIAHLPESVNKQILLHPLEFDVPLPYSVDPPVNVEFEDRFNKVIHGYLNAMDYGNAIVWVGQDDFDTAIDRFWKLIAPLDRQRLNIGICFNVSSISESKLNLLTIPDRIENKFVNKSICVVRKTDRYVLETLQELILAKDTEAVERVEAFKEALEVRHINMSDFENISRVLPTFESIDTCSDLKKLNSLSHVIAVFSQHDTSATKIKRRLLERMASLLLTESSEGITLIRHFKIGSYLDSEHLLSHSLSKWLKENLFSRTESKKTDFNPMLKVIYGQNLQNWWSKKMSSEVTSFLKSLDENKIATIVNWLKNGFDDFKHIIKDIDRSSAAEKLFVEQTSTETAEMYFPVLIDLAIKKKWFSYYAYLQKVNISFEEAISLQLKIDKNEKSIDGLQILCDKIAPKKLIAATIYHKDPRLIDLSIEQCSGSPSLLGGIDFKDTVWLQIWNGTIKAGNEVALGFKNSSKKVFEFYDAFISHENAPDGLLETLANSEYGNILEYPKRKEFWAVAPAAIKQIFLQNTSSKLLQAISLNPTTGIPNDAELKAYIKSHALAEFLYYNRASLKSVVPIFNALPTIEDYIVKDYITNYPSDVAAIEATQLGKIIIARNYHDSAYAIYKKADKANNWRYALVECQMMLDFATRGWMAISGIISGVKIPSAEWWDGALDVISDFYPNSTAITYIWKQAGGKEADLKISATGSEVWADLLHKLRNGHFKKATMETLLKEINKKHSENQKFKLVYNLRHNYL